MTPRAFGEKLRREREKRRITVTQLATRTKVAATLFRALERGDCSRWPGGIYSRSFVRAYAESVGMDPEQTVALFIESYPEFAPQADPIEAEVQEPQPTWLDRARSAVEAILNVAVDSRR